MPEKDIVKKAGGEAVFNKQELLQSRRFSDNRDLAAALLAADRTYSIREAEEEIEKFLKGEVRTWH